VGHCAEHCACPDDPTRFAQRGSHADEDRNSLGICDGDGNEGIRSNTTGISPACGLVVSVGKNLRYAGQQFTRRHWFLQSYEIESLRPCVC
jgi:hypothetical protein